MRARMAEADAISIESKRSEEVVQEEAVAPVPAKRETLSKDEVERF